MSTDTVTTGWWTPAEAAAYLVMEESRLRRLAQKGLIASHKDGLFVRFTKADCDDYVAACSRPRGNPYQTTR